MQIKRVWAVLAVVALSLPLAAAASADEAPPINVDPEASAPAFIQPNPDPTQRRQSRAAEDDCFEYTENGETYEACMTEGGGEGDPFLRGSAPTERADEFPVPDLCLWTFQGQVGDRKEECNIQPAYLTITNDDGVIVGELFYNTYQWTLTVDTYNHFSSTLAIEPWVSWGQGAGWTVHAEHDAEMWGCGDSCEITEWSFDGGLATETSVHSGVAYYEAEIDPGEYDTSWSGNWAFWFTRAGVRSTTAWTRETTVRCDDVLPGSTVVGCVIPNYPGYIDVKQIDAPTYRQHLANAIASGLPGGQSNPLHRLTDPVLIAQNRTKACPTGVAWLPRPPGYECDEYPFASSYEGAFTGGGDARTFDTCQVTLQGLPSEGSVGYSICMILAGDNSLGGSQLATEHREQRIIDGDPFWLDVMYPS